MALKTELKNIFKIQLIFGLQIQFGYIPVGPLNNIKSCNIGTNSKKKYDS